MAIPHFSIPFQVGPFNSVVTVEQDTVDEIAQCVSVLLLTEIGERLSVPDYGIPDVTFDVAIPLAVIRTAIDRWEPRARVILDERPDLLDELVRRIGVTVWVAT